MVSLSNTLGGVRERSMTIQVVLADDHWVIRTSIRNSLEKQPDIVVVAEANNGVEALRMVEIYQPDVLLLDMEMPGLTGVEIARKLQEAGSSVRILALSAYTDRHYIEGLLDSGAAGYLIKSETPQTIIKAIRGIARGEKGWISRQVAARMNLWTEAQEEETKLTRQEIVILKLLVAGKTNHDIGVALGVSEKTVRENLERIYHKIGVSSRVAAAMKAVQEGIV
jgi:DNA-binding NarL/FixJ family response regulator